MFQWCKRKVSTFFECMGLSLLRISKGGQFSYAVTEIHIKRSNHLNGVIPYVEQIEFSFR